MKASTRVLRQELARLPVPRACCALAELTALLGRSCGDPALGVQVKLGPAAARRAMALTRALEAAAGAGAGAWHLVTGRGRRATLSGPACPTVVRKKCCRRAYLRGAMLRSSSLTDPRRSAHLEIGLDRTAPIEPLLEDLRRAGFRPGLLMRESGPLVYLKSREEVARLLGELGAVQSMLALEDVTVARRMKEGINRTVNCEVSNLLRTSRAARDQLAAIALLEERNLLVSLPVRLQEVARLRRSYPYDDLNTLAARSLTPERPGPGELTRSGVFHRLRDLVRLARDLQSDEGDDAVRTP